MAHSKKRDCAAGEPLQNTLGCGSGLVGSGWEPPADVQENQEGFRIVIELPGVPPEEVCVELRGRDLWVFGCKPGGSTKGEYLMLERTCGRFVRKFPLGVEVDTDSIQAEMRDGLLTVSVVRKSPERRTIPVG